MADKTETQSSTSSQSTPSTGSSSSGARSKDDAELRTAELTVDADDPGIDPRLDNRTGDQRPKVEEFPAKPQQVDGPELGQEKAVRARASRKASGTAKGAKSPGPHGLGDTADQV